MASVVNYRFQSFREYSQVCFEGNSIPLWELKYEIVSQRRMNSKDFDLFFYDGETEEQIVDEYASIVRNSYIVVKRVPGWMSKGAFQVKERRTEPLPMKKFLKEPPENYVCFRCGNRGHFIQHCPTNSDPNFDIVKIRKPSGIPKDFLERVDEGGLTAGAGGAGLSKAMLVTEEGFVKAKPQTGEWTKQGSVIRGLGSIPRHLKCPLCHGLVSNPVVTDCGHSFCERCVRPGDKCAVCGERVQTLRMDEPLTGRLEEYLGRR